MTTMPTGNGRLRVLGIDPGLLVTGYGMVESAKGSLRAIEHGVFQSPATAPLSERLLALHAPLLDLVRRLLPDAVAVEEPFLGENTRSALMLGRAQAVAFLAAAMAGVPVFTYAPARVKTTVAGYGRSEKNQVAEMVRAQLGLPNAPEPADAADALAVAICHAAYAQTRLVELRR